MCLLSGIADLAMAYLLAQHHHFARRTYFFRAFQNEWYNKYGKVSTICIVKYLLSKLILQHGLTLLNVVLSCKRIAHFNSSFSRWRAHGSAERNTDREFALYRPI
jgi:hypothetical protein